MDEILESTLGKLCIATYALFVIGSYLYATGCGTEACSLTMVWPILPWAFILASDLGLAFPWAMYPIFILINTTVAYIIGAGVESLYRAYRERHTGSTATTARHTTHAAHKKS